MDYINKNYVIILGFVDIEQHTQVRYLTALASLPAPISQ